jgi:cobalt-zinc-cadmium efflux system outer membrane protein
LGQELAVYQPPATRPPEHTASLPEFTEPTGALELQQALAMALRHNPELAAFSWEIRAAEARELQARLLPNPEVSAEFENVGGDLQGFRESENTYTLSQNILFEPKRSRAMRLAAAEKKVAGWDYETKRLDVFTDVVQAFVGVLGAQEKVKLTEETARIAQDVLRVATRRVELGDAPPVERTRAEVVHAQVVTELERAKQELLTARIRLAALWSSTSPRFAEARGTLQCKVALPSLEQLRERLLKNPELMGAAAEVVRRQAALDLERAKRLPDVTAQAGYRRIRAIGEDDADTAVNTAVFGFAVPLPIFDRNQGAIQEAKANLAQAEWKKKHAEVRVLSALAEAHSDLATTLKERQTFDTQILPGTTEAFRKTQQGYVQGTFNYLELLTAQEELAKARGDYVNVLVRLNQAVATVERLVGEPIVSTATSAQGTKEQK